MQDGGWSETGGARWVEDGGWRMEDGGWIVAWSGRSFRGGWCGASAQQDGEGPESAKTCHKNRHACGVVPVGDGGDAFAGGHPDEQRHSDEVEQERHRQ